MEKNTIFSEAVAFFTKTWAWFFYVAIGLIGKVGLMLQKKKKSTGWELLGTTLIAGFVGYLATIYCMIHYPINETGYSVQGAIIVPMATLLSDRVMSFLWNFNWLPILESIIGRKFKNDNKQEDIQEEEEE